MLVTDKKFSQILTNLAKRITMIDADIQRAAVYAIHQSIEHRNATPANGLYQVVSKCKGVVRADSLAMFLERHGHLAFMKADKTIAFFDHVEIFGVAREFNEEVLMATPWRLAKAVPDTESEWDVKDMLATIIAKVEKALTKNERSIKNVTLLGELKALVAKGNIDIEPKDEDADVKQQLADASLARLAA